jgi:hypothetical protein
MRRHLRLAALTSSLLAIGAGAGHDLAAQDPPPVGRSIYSGGIVNRASGKALDVTDKSMDDGANIQQWDFANGANQIWDVVHQGLGQYSIISKLSGRGLDVENKSTDDGANIQQYRFAKGANQLWRLEQQSGGYYQIVNVGSGKCLDVENTRIKENGANVQQWRCAGAPNQLWRLGK